MEKKNQKKKEINGGESPFKIKCREIVGTVSILTVMMLSGIILDNVYKGVWKIPWISGVADVLKGFLSRQGITYQSALKILSSNVGVLMTMVSLFLTMNINIAERFEKTIYGITRKELFYSPKDRWYRWTKRIGYFTPMLMVVFLNLSYCISGYLLFFYNYLFLIIHYYRHVSSYSDDKTKSALIRKLVRLLPDDRFYNEDDILECKMFLENVGNSIEENGAWSDAESLFLRLLDDTKTIVQTKREALCHYFYQIVYWKRSHRNKIASMRTLKVCIENLDKASAKGKVDDKEWAVIEGMMAIAFSQCTDDELVAFLQWFLNQPERGGRVFRETQKVWPAETFRRQVGIALVLLEQRLRLRGANDEHLREPVRILWNIGKNTFFGEEFQWENSMEAFGDDWTEKNKYSNEEIIKDLKSDYLFKTQRTVTVNIAVM